MSSFRHIVRSSVQCAITGVVVAVLISTVLPWLAKSGYAGDVIEFSYRNQRDATPLFYSESDRTWELLEEIEARQGDE